MPPQDTETARWFADEVQPHEPALRAYLHGFTSPTDIDDVVQHAYIKLLQMRDRVPLKSPRGALFTIARNAARNLHRNRVTRRTESLEEIDATEAFADAPSAAEFATHSQEAELLSAAINALPARCREVLVLRKFEQLSHREIAQKLHISENTVEAHLTKALRRCEEFFAAKGALP